MAIDYAAIAAVGGLGKGTPRALSKGWKKAAKDAALQDAYDQVDARDKKRCQVTGVRLTAGHVEDAKALERDHLAPRSTDKARVTDPDNILTVSRKVHQLLQSSALHVLDTHGRETTRVSQIAGFRFNRAMVPAGKEPFKLRRPYRAAAPRERAS